jgi:hypothetical protein
VNVLDLAQMFSYRDLQQLQAYDNESAHDIATRPD